LSENSSVRTIPGAISITRTGSPHSSSRSVSASVCTPCLAAVYDAPPSYEISPAVELTNSTSPAPDERSAGSSAFVTRTVPSTFTS
jgi:hypothetical protein